MTLLRKSLKVARYLLLAALVLLTALLGVAYWQAANRETKTNAEAAPTTGHLVQAHDVRLFVQEEGPRNGPAVVFVHGTGAWSETWKGAMQATAARGFHAVALDLPPFGFSTRPEKKDYSSPEQARRILGVLDSLNAGRAVLVGHSFGARATVEAAMSNRGRISRLVLVDPALTPDAASAAGWGVTIMSLAPVRAALSRAVLTNPIFTRTILQRFVADPAAATDAWVDVYKRPLSVKGTAAAVGDWLPELLAPRDSASSRSEEFRKLNVPTLLVWGEKDTVTPLADGRRLEKLLPDAKLVILPGVGHIPQIEDPAGLNSALTSFLGEPSGASVAPPEMRRPTPPRRTEK